jgi:hypothetical protein
VDAKSVQFVHLSHAACRGGHRAVDATEASINWRKEGGEPENDLAALDTDIADEVQALRVDSLVEVLRTASQRQRPRQYGRLERLVMFVR